MIITSDENKIDAFRQLLLAMTWNEVEAIALSLERYRSGAGHNPEGPITGRLLVGWAEDGEIE